MDVPSHYRTFSDLLENFTDLSSLHRLGDVIKIKFDGMNPINYWLFMGHSEVKFEHKKDANDAF